MILQEATRPFLASNRPVSFTDEQARQFAEMSRRIRPVIADMPSFRQHNLMKPLGDDGFDPIVPRNVLIYFDSKSKSAAMHNVGAALKPDGFLMTGGAEGGAEFLKDYRRIEPRLYGKPGR